jgi:hypothetical protein
LYRLPAGLALLVLLVGMVFRSRLGTLGTAS